MKKRIIAIAVCGALTVSLAACGSSGTLESGKATTGSEEQEVIEEVAVENSEEQEGAESDEEISDFPAEYDGCTLDVTDADTDGEYITVYATYTNDNNEPSYALNSFKLKVFQGGISLDDASNFAGDEASQMKEIKDGASYDVTYKFKLENDEDEIEIMACAPTEDQDILAKTFYSLSELEAFEETEETVEESAEFDEEADEDVSIEKAEEIDESQEVKLVEGYSPVELGGSIEQLGEVSFKMSFDSFDFESEISYATGEHFTTNITSHDGNQLAVLKGHMENNSSIGISHVAFDLSFVANGEYEYDSVNLMFESNNSSKIEPLSEEVFDIYVEVPDNLVDQFETGVFYIGFKEDMSSITYITSSDSDGNSASYTDADHLYGVIVPQEKESVQIGDNVEINNTENSITGPLTIDDFIVAGLVAEQYADYDYNVYNLYTTPENPDSSPHYSCFYYSSDSTDRKEDIIETARGIKLGSSLDDVVEAYGDAGRYDFDRNDFIYSDVESYNPEAAQEMKDQCSTYVAYRYQYIDDEDEWYNDDNAGQIVFYLDDNGDVAWIVYMCGMAYANMDPRFDVIFD